jgi:hypothetical protein
MNKIITLAFLFVLSPNCVFSQNDDPHIIIGNVYDEKAKSQLNIIPKIECIEYIKNTSHREGIITSILYKLYNPKSKATKIIRPHLYLLSNGKVGEEIHPDMPLVYVKQREKELIVEVDLSEYGISLPSEGIFVGLEFVDIKTEYESSIDDMISIWHNEKNKSSLSYTKYKNVFDKKNPSQGFCFGVKIKND